LNILKKKADKSPNSAGNTPSNKDKKRELERMG